MSAGLEGKYKIAVYSTDLGDSPREFAGPFSAVATQVMELVADLKRQGFKYTIDGGKEVPRQDNSGTTQLVRPILNDQEIRLLRKKEVKNSAQISLAAFLGMMRVD